MSIIGGGRDKSAPTDIQIILLKAIIGPYEWLGLRNIGGNGHDKHHCHAMKMLLGGKRELPCQNV
jgi:hypothetical protein